ncbi:N/A [soil metagenome]
MGRLSEAKRSRRSLVTGGVVSVVVAVVDLSTKSAVTRRLGPSADKHDWWLIEGWLGFAYGRNSGAAFGLFQGNAGLLAAISVLVAIGFCCLTFAEVHGPVARALSAGLLLGGAIGNLVERVRQSYVTDFIAVGPWPRFNVADSAISVAVVIFAVAVLFQARPETGDDGNGSRSRHAATHPNAPDSEQQHEDR